VGWEKVACWSTKAAISLKCVKVEEKLLWRAYRNSPMLFEGYHPRPLRLPLPEEVRFEGFAPLTQNFSRYYIRNGQSIQISNLACTVTGSIRTKAHLKKFGEKGAWAYQGTAQFFKVPPIISGTGKTTDFKFCVHIYRIDQNKSH